MTGDKIEVLLPAGGSRAALAAARPHLPADPDDQRQRVRLSFTTADCDAGAQVLVSASDAYTAVVSRVELHEVVTLPALAVVDLPPESVRDVLAVFRPPSGRDAKAAWLDSSLRLTITADECTWTEASQLVEGKSLTVPVLAPLPESDTAYPDVPGVLARVLEEPPSAGESSVQPPMLAAALDSARAWGASVIDVTVHGPGVVTWSAGNVVLGFVTTHRLEREGLMRRDASLADWRRDLLPLARPRRAPVDDNADDTSVTISTPDGGASVTVQLADLDTALRLRPVRTLALPHHADPSEIVDLTPPAADELLVEAAELVITSQFASTSMLQRKLRIGHARAHVLMGLLEHHGIVSATISAGKDREVLISHGDLAERVLARLAELTDSTTGDRA